MVTTNKGVGTAWLNGQSAKSHNGNMSTDGHNIWSFDMVIGRTMPDGTKQLLDVTGVNAYSTRTAQHVGFVWSAWFQMKRQNAELEHMQIIAPDVTGGHEKFCGWRHFPKNLTTIEVRSTSQVWKTYKGALKHLKTGYHIIEVNKGYTLAYNQQLDENGYLKSYSV